MTDLTEIRRAVILAAGIGARLAHHTEHAPKPLLNVAGRPLIEHTLIALKDSGIQEVVVIAGYRGDALEEALKPMRGVSLCVVHNTQFGRGASFSLAAARASMGQDPFLLVMSDHLLSSQLLTRLMKSEPRDACRVAADSGRWPTAYVEEATLLQTTEDGHVLRIGKGISPFSALDAGAFACTREIWTALDEAPLDCDLSTVFSRLVARGRLFAADVSGCPWFDIDTPEDIPLAEAMLAEARTPVVADS